MKRMHILIMVFYILPVSLSAQVVDRIVALVNGEIICLSELKQFSLIINREAEKSNPALSQESRLVEIEKNVLDQLVNQKLLNQEAKRLKIEVNKKEVDRAIENIQKRNSFSRRDFLNALKKEGLTIDTYREQIEQEMKKVRLIEYEIKSKVNITDDAIQDYYIKNMAKPEIKEGVRIQQILLIIPPESNEEKVAEIKALAKVLLSGLEKGEDFGILAQQFSQDNSAQVGGDLGFFKKGELLPILEETAYQLKEGEVSPLIQSNLGFHIIKVLEKREGEVRLDGWMRSRDQIKNILSQRESEKMFEQWMKTLREKSYIEIRL